VIFECLYIAKLLIFIDLVKNLTDPFNGGILIVSKANLYKEIGYLAF